MDIRTGKTRTSAELIRQWVAAKKNEKQGCEVGLILAAAQTNIAVDNLMEKMISLGLTVLRIASSGTH
jgi:hypothetical protein